MNLHAPKQRKAKRPILRLVFEDRNILNRKKNLFFSDLRLSEESDYHRFKMFKPKEFRKDTPEHQRKFQSFWKKSGHIIVKMKSSLQMCLKHLDDHWKVIEQLESFEQVGISSTNLGFLPFHQTVFLESTSLLEAKNTSLVFREAFKRAVLSLNSPYEAQRNWDIEICFKDLMDNALVPSQHLNHAPDHIRDGDASVCYHWFVDTDGLEVDTEVWNQAEHVSVNPLKQFFSGRYHVGLVKLMKKAARSQQHFSKCHLVHLLQPNMEIFDYDFSPASRERVLDLYLQRATHYETDEPQVKVGVSVLWSGTNSFFSLVDEEGLVRKMLGTHPLQNSRKNAVLSKVLESAETERHVHSSKPTEVLSAGVYFKKTKEQKFKFSLPFQTKFEEIPSEVATSSFTTLRWAFQFLNNNQPGFVCRWLEKNECSALVDGVGNDSQGAPHHAFCRAHTDGFTCVNHSV